MVRSLLFIVILILCTLASDARKVYFDRTNATEFVFPTAQLDSVLKPQRYNAFFYGETHTRYFEPLFKLEYIKYLNRTCGIRDVFMEIGYSPAVLFNQYVETGDTSLINFKVLYTSPNYMKLWKGLYEYNQTLPADKRIRIHGVDFEGGKTLFKALLALRRKNEVPSSLVSIFNNISLYEADTLATAKAEFAKRQKEIRTIFNTHQAEVKALYGTDAAVVNKMLKNNMTIMDPQRDQKMFKNMQAALRAEHIKKFVGFFGGDHINNRYTTALPNALRKDKTFKGKICSVQMYCFDAVDNWSQETIECIGTYDEKQGHQLHQKYSGESRAVLISKSNVTESFLKGIADYYLFANDK